MWWIIGTFFLLVFLWIAWEIHNAPLMPDDYDLDEEDELFLKEMKNVHRSL